MKWKEGRKEGIKTGGKKNEGRMKKGEKGEKVEGICLVICKHKMGMRSSYP